MSLLGGSTAQGEEGQRAKVGMPTHMHAHAHTYTHAHAPVHAYARTYKHAHIHMYTRTHINRNRPYSVITNRWYKFTRAHAGVHPTPCPTLAVACPNPDTSPRSDHVVLNFTYYSQPYPDPDPDLNPNPDPYPYPDPGHSLSTSNLYMPIGQDVVWGTRKSQSERAEECT